MSNRYDDHDTTCARCGIAIRESEAHRMTDEEQERHLGFSWHCRRNDAAPHRYVCRGCAAVLRIERAEEEEEEEE